jgi:hypothetical protein
MGEAAPTTSRPTRPSAAVVVPLLRPELRETEKISLAHLRRFLGEYDKFVVMPRSIDGGLDGFGVQRFDDSFFRDRETYSSLLLTRRFYEAFRAYEYILIYQLDSLVFADELPDWCCRGLDFVGAPWIDVEWLDAPAVGNGGFSLRRVGAFLSVLTSKRYWMDPDEYWRTFWGARSRAVRLMNLPRKYVKRLHRFNGVQWETSRWLRGTNTSRTWGRNEDFFWSFEARRYYPQFAVATVEEALRFAFETSPRLCFELAGQKLPFGCHGWPKYDRNFWEPFLLR